MRMKSRAGSASLLIAATALAASGLARGAAPADTHIYQQRTADGRIVLTDRPAEGAPIVRAWQIAPDDPDAARQRREQARQEAAQVSERIQRRIDEQQARSEQLETERLRSSLAQARREADAAREAAIPAPVVVAPRWYDYRPGDRLDRRPPPRVEPGRGHLPSSRVEPGRGHLPSPGTPRQRPRPSELRDEGRAP